MVGDPGPNAGPANNQTNQPTYKKQSFLARSKNALLSHRAKEFVKDPRTWLELAALIVLGVYTWYAGLQSSTMTNTLVEIRKQTSFAEVTATQAQQQTELTRRQLIATQPAVIDAMIDIHIGDISKQNGSEVDFQLRNIGYVFTATPVHVQGSISRVRLPDHHVVVGTPLPVNFYFSAIRPIPYPAPDERERRNYLIDVLPPEFGAIARLKRTVKAQGTISYDNGYKEMKVLPFCKLYAEGGTWECDGFDVEFPMMLRRLNAATGHQTPAK